jgi:integrase
MARRAEGWKLELDPRTGIYRVRFTHGGRRHKLTTGERDPSEAAKRAARIYAETVSGRRAPEVGGGDPVPLDETAALWLADVEPTLRADTFTLWEQTYVRKHFAPFFETMDRLTTVGVEDYVAHRLRQVQRPTVTKELSVLRRFCRWAHKRGHLAELPTIEGPARTAAGKIHDEGRKRRFLIFTAAEIEAVIAQLPEWSRSKKTRGDRYPVRARFIVAWETGLRPSTLARITTPTDYRRGAAQLVIRDEADKAAFGRELPLSARAREALDGVCREAGLIFGDHDYREPLRAAAKTAGIDEMRAAKISDYDFRHSRATQLGGVTDNLAGVAYLLGHRQVTTTNRYMRPQIAQAEEVLVAAGGLRPHSGPTNDEGPIQVDRPSTEDLVFSGSARGGTRTPTVLPASTSRHRGLVSIGNFTASTRQEAAVTPLQARDCGPGGQNSTVEIEVPRAWRDAAKREGMTVEAWVRAACDTALRKAKNVR